MKLEDKIEKAKKECEYNARMIENYKYELEKSEKYLNILEFEKQEKEKKEK